MIGDVEKVLLKSRKGQPVQADLVHEGASITFVLPRSTPLTLHLEEEIAATLPGGRGIVSKSAFGDRWFVVTSKVT